MDTVKRIAKNTVVLSVSTVLGQGLGFFYIIYAARHLGVEGFGILSFALAFTVIFGIFTDFGLQFLTVREVARDKTLSAKYFSNLSAMKLIMCVATFGVIAITINLMDYPRSTVMVVYLLTLSTMLNSFITLSYSIFQAHEKMEYQAIGQVISGVVLFLGAVVAVKLGYGVRSFALLLFFAGVFSMVFCFVVLKMRFPEIFSQWLRQTLKFDRAFWERTLKETFSFGLIYLFVAIFYWIGIVMLSSMKGDAAVGLYNAAYRVVLAFSFIPQSFVAAIFPVTSVFHMTSSDSMRLSFEKSFKYLFILGFLVSLGTMMLSEKVILLIFGNGYAQSVMALKILAWSSVCIFINSSFVNLFYSINRQIIVTKMMVIACALNILLNIMLIPTYSFIGVGIAMVLTDFSILLISFIWSYKIGYTIPARMFLSILAKIAVAGVLAALFITQFYNLTLVVLVPTVTLLYFMTLYIVGGIDKEDISLLKYVVR